MDTKVSSVLTIALLLMLSQAISGQEHPSQHSKEDLVQSGLHLLMAEDRAKWQDASAILAPLGEAAHRALECELSKAAPRIDPPFARDLMESIRWRGEVHLEPLLMLDRCPNESIDRIDSVISLRAWRPFKHVRFYVVRIAGPNDKCQVDLWVVREFDHFPRKLTRLNGSLDGCISAVISSQLQLRVESADDAALAVKGLVSLSRGQEDSLVDVRVTEVSGDSWRCEVIDVPESREVLVLTSNKGLLHSIVVDK